MLFFCKRRTFIQFKLQKLQFWPLNDQITVSFVRAAGVLAKGRMFDMPALNEYEHTPSKCQRNTELIIQKTESFVNTPIHSELRFAHDSCNILSVI